MSRNQIRLFILVILAFLPAVGIYVYASAALESHEMDQRRQELLQFANVAGVEYQRLLDESEDLLGALAEMPEIRDGGPVCSRRLASVLRHVEQYTTISLIGIDGYMECGSLTVDDGLYLGDRYYYQSAFRTNRFAVGHYAIGRITGKPTVGVGYPIADEAGTGVQAVLAASLDLSSLGENALRMELPEEATFTVLDQDGTVLVRVPAGRHPLGYDTVGATAPESFPTLSAGLTAAATLMGTDLDGVDRMFAVTPLRGNGPRAQGHLLVGLEEAMLLQDAREQTSRELTYLALAGIAVLILAWLFGHYALVRTASGSVAA
jgi:Cache domain